MQEYVGIEERDKLTRCFRGIRVKSSCSLTLLVTILGNMRGLNFRINFANKIIYFIMIIIFKELHHMSPF